MNTYPRAVEQFLDTLREVGKLRLYLLTLVVEAFTAGLLRKFLGQEIWPILDWKLHLAFSPGFIGRVCMFGPLIWSASAFWLPGSGARWRRRVGARDPSRREARRIDEAFEGLGEPATRGLKQLHFYVIDTVDRFLFIRGDALITSRGLLESPEFIPVLAHDVGHARTTDGRLMLALDRLALFGSPLLRAREEDARWEEGARGAKLVSASRWVFRLAGGTLTLRAMWPLWANYLRKRERAADAHAVALGQGPALAGHLENWKQPMEAPLRYALLLFNMENHDRVAYRLDLLLGEPLRPGESEATGLDALRQRFWSWVESWVDRPRPMEPKALFEPAKRFVESVFAVAGAMAPAEIDAQAWVLASLFAEHPVELTTSQLITRVQAVAEDPTLPVQDAIEKLAAAHALEIDGESDAISLTEPALALREHALL